MAIKNPITKEYYRIINIHPYDKEIMCEIYKDEAHRQSGDTTYLKKRIKEFREYDDITPLIKIADSKKSIRDNYLTAGYLLLKTIKIEDEYDILNNEDFKNFEDC